MTLHFSLGLLGVPFPPGGNVTPSFASFFVYCGALGSRGVPWVALPAHPRVGVSLVGSLPLAFSLSFPRVPLGGLGLNTPEWGLPPSPRCLRWKVATIQVEVADIGSIHQEVIKKVEAQKKIHPETG